MSGPATGGGGSGDIFGNIFGSRDDKIEQNIPGYTIVKLPGRMQMLPAAPSAGSGSGDGVSGMPGAGGYGGYGGRTRFMHQAGTQEGDRERALEYQRRRSSMYELTHLGRPGYPMPSGYPGPGNVSAPYTPGESISGQQGPYPGLPPWPTGLPMPPPPHHYMYPENTDEGAYERALWKAQKAQRYEGIYQQAPQLRPAAATPQPAGAPALPGQPVPTVAVPAQSVTGAPSPYGNIPLNQLPQKFNQLPAVVAPSANAAPSAPPAETSYNQAPGSGPPKSQSTIDAILSTLGNMLQGRSTPAFGPAEPGQATPSAPPVGPQSFNQLKGPDTGSMRYEPLPDEEEAA